MNDKIYKILIVLLLIYTVIVIVLFGTKNNNKKIDGLKLIVGDSTIWEFKNKNWNNITNIEDINKLSWNEFKIYQDNEYIGKHQLWFNDKRWYVFDENKKAINIDGNLFAYQNKYELNVLKFEAIENEEKDNKYVKDILKKNKLPINSEFTVNKYINVDIDNDNKSEKIFIISNAFLMNSNASKDFTIVFMIKDEKPAIMYKKISNKQYKDVCKPYINTIIDINNDNIYEIILSCGKYSVEKQLDMLYEFKEGKFRLLIYNE